MDTIRGKVLRQLTEDERAALTPTGHQSSQPLDGGGWVEVIGCAGTLDGVWSIDWVTRDGRTTGWTR